jgi:hypothetical protein
MAIIFSLCFKADMLLGVELGLLCLFPLLFILLVPFLFAEFIVEITRSPQSPVALAEVIPPPYIFVPPVYLQVPLSPPRFASRDARQNHTA